VDLGFDDGPIARSATAAEAVSYANTVELLANIVLRGRSGSQSPRGDSLASKIYKIINPVAPNLADLLRKFRHLTNTNKSTLRRRISHIDRIKQGSSHASILRVLLKLIVIRNEGSHLGLSGFDRSAIYDLLESLVQASLLLWKAR
jgi:hypothetical protein